jgi:hypothetical protein
MVRQIAPKSNTGFDFSGARLELARYQPPDWRRACAEPL